MKKKILITGVAGFIGYNAANELIKSYKIYGIDNLDDYYSPKIKRARLAKLVSNKNFEYKNINISNLNKLDNYIKKKKISIIIHLAGQAGVRYSFINPEKYIDSNIIGFLNIALCAKKNFIKKVIYASSSSVYGDSRNYPLKENNALKPKNIYSMSKKINEQIAEYYQKHTSIKFIGIRFFTIFGEWGRPDMFLFKLFKAYKLKKNIELNNFGNHERDFTYIGDVLNILKKLILKKFSKHIIINVCSNKPQNILNIVNEFKKNNFLRIKFVKLHKADVLKTHGDNHKVKKLLKIKKFSNFKKSFLKTLKWYEDNHFYKF